MKLKVPFYESVGETDCGLIVLKMVLSYFGGDASFEEISRLERQLENGMVWTLGIARAAKKLGFKTKFISIDDTEASDDIDFYKKYADDKAKIVLNELKKEVREIGVEIERRNIGLEELLSYASEDSIPIVLLNWYVVRGKEGFHGHFVPVTGYDDENIYVHNPGKLNAQAYFPIKRDLFLKAWESKGTDKDCVVVYRKAR